MLMQKNANINVMAHEELETDVESGHGRKDKSTQKKCEPGLKWNPTRPFKDERKVIPFFQVRLTFILF